MRDGSVSWACHANAVGVGLTFQGSSHTVKVEANMSSAMHVANRVSSLPLGFDIRTVVLQGGVIPKSLHGCEVSIMLQRLLSRLRTGVLNSLWGNGRKMRCPEIVFTLLSRGHLSDPLQADMYRSLVTFQSMMCKRVD
eukprot:11325372-Karenia_brevis.AAC.1